MTNTQFLRSLPQAEYPRGFTRPLTGAELLRLREIAAQRLCDAACVHTPAAYADAHEARMLLATI